MNYRKTFFLIVLVGLVGSVVVWDHFKGVTTTHRVSQSKRILTLNTKQVSHFELVNSNQTIVLEKNGDNWDIKQPLAVRADFGAVSSILSELEFAERSRTLTEPDLQGASLADFGLAPPRASIKLQTKSGLITLLIGNATPTKSAVYVQVAGRREVCVVPPGLYERATPSLAALRSRTAIEFTPAAVTRLELKTADRMIELKKNESHWTVVRPLAVRADQDKISELLSGLTGLQIQDFVSDDPKDLHNFHLDEPDREVTVWTGEVGKTLLIGRSPTNDPGRVYAKLKNADSIFTLEGEPVKKFAVQINDLRDPQVLAFEPAAVKSITIARGTDSIALQRDAAGWQLTAPVGVPADETAVRRFLADLAGLRAKRFVADVTTDSQQYGLTRPAATVTLTGNGTNVLVQLLVGSVDTTNSLQFAKCSNAEFIYGIATNFLELFPVNYSKLRSRSVFDWKTEQITQLVDGSVTLARAQGQWKLVTPAQGVVDVDAVNALVGVLAKLQAETFGQPKAEPAPAAGDTTTIRATIGDATHWLTLATNGQASASSVELPFQLPASAVATLLKPVLTAAKP